MRDITISELLAMPSRKSPKSLTADCSLVAFSSPLKYAFTVVPLRVSTKWKGVPVSPVIKSMESRSGSPDDGFSNNIQPTPFPDILYTKRDPLLYISRRAALNIKLEYTVVDPYELPKYSSVKSPVPMGTGLPIRAVTELEVMDWPYPIFTPFAMRRNISSFGSGRITPSK